MRICFSDESSRDLQKLLLSLEITFGSPRTSPGDFENARKLQEFRDSLVFNYFIQGSAKFKINTHVAFADQG